MEELVAMGTRLMLVSLPKGIKPLKTLRNIFIRATAAELTTGRTVIDALPGETGNIRILEDCETVNARKFQQKTRRAIKDSA